MAAGGTTRPSGTWMKGGGVPLPLVKCGVVQPWLSHLCRDQKHQAQSVTASSFNVSINSPFDTDLVQRNPR